MRPNVTTNMILTAVQTTRVRSATFAILGLFMLLSFIQIIIGGVGVDAGGLQILPTNLATGVLLIGLAVLILSVLLLVGTLIPLPALVIAMALFLFFAVIGQFTVGAFALSQTEWWYRIDANFEQAWRSAPLALQQDVQHRFGCCGYDGPQDYYGPQWNESCPTRELEREECCVDMRLWRNTTLGSCMPHQPRYQCCDSSPGGGDAWPCYRLQSCRVLVLDWLHVLYKAMAVTGLLFGAIELIGLVLVLVGTMMVAKSDRRRNTTPLGLDDDDMTEDGF